MPFKTRITEMLGIEHPIVMGGLTGVGTPELAAAVSNAGGIGLICSHQAGSPEKYLEWCARMPQLTSKPWGVNLTILREFSDAEKYLNAIIESGKKYGVKVIETAGRNPAQFIPKIKKELPNSIVIHKCTSIRHSLSAIRIGADIISLDGFECAGHPGEDDVGNFVLQAVGAKKLTVPFICSGGVASGRQIAAALAMGAEGVNIGTLFCVSKECVWPQAFKERLFQSDETQTTITLRPVRNSSRIFKNKMADQINDLEKKHWANMKFEDYGGLMRGTLGRAAEEEGRKSEATGDKTKAQLATDNGTWAAGQGIGLMDELESCQQIMDRLVLETEACIKDRLGSLLTSKL